MSRLTRQTAALPEQERLPERILQFGDGNFLRGFADDFVDRMNREADFNQGLSGKGAHGSGRKDGAGGRPQPAHFGEQAADGGASHSLPSRGQEERGRDGAAVPAGGLCIEEAGQDGQRDGFPPVHPPWHPRRRVHGV